MFDIVCGPAYKSGMKKPQPSPAKRASVIGVRTTQELKASVMLAAAKERRSVSQWIEGLILDALAKKPGK
jgi:predicted HicB family RNase H-like nuclease